MKTYRISGLRFLSILAVVAIFAIGISHSAFAHSPKPPKGYIEPSQCGGVGQPTCELSRAWYLGKVKRSKPSHRAFFDPRKGGEWWECPSDRPQRTLNKVTGPRACATKKIAGKKHSRAKFLGKTKNKKPEGAFADIRKGGEYWKCPAGFWRNLNAVTDKAACTVNVGQNCDSGNIAIAGALFKGEDITKYQCYKKRECGGRKQRPCQLTERIPSCNSGLAEDFINNSCVNPALRDCLFWTSIFRLADKVERDISKVEKELLKLLNDFRKSVFGSHGKKLSKEQAEKIDSAIDKVFSANASYSADEILAGAQFLSVLMPEFKKIEAAIKRNKKKIKAFMLNSDKCFMSEKDRMHEFGVLLGFVPSTGKIKKASLDMSPWWHPFAIKAANAANTTTNNIYFNIGISMSGNYSIVGGTIALYSSTNFANETGKYFAIGPELTTSTDEEFGASFGFSVGFMVGDDISSNEGWGSGVGISGSLGSSEITAGIEIGLNDFLKDEKIEVQGLNLILGAETGEGGSVSGSASYTYSWKLGNVDMSKTK